MTAREELLRLAGRIGIEPRYTDALGQTREVGNETLMALFEAFGLPSDPMLAARDLEAAALAEPLGIGPVHLIHAEASRPAIAMRLPDGWDEVAWTCRLESGEERAGRVSAPRGRPFGLPLPAALPVGYHDLHVSVGAVAAQTTLIVAPASCYLPPELGPEARSWGLACQLYGLRSARNWGIGDFTDLAALGRAAGEAGAATVGINPLHALFAEEPLHYSPYSPSSRHFLDYRYLDPTAVPGFAEDAEVRALMAGEWFGATHWAARSADLIDYGAVAACKRRVLEALWRRFRAHDLGEAAGAVTDLGGRFREHQQRGGPRLAEFAVFEALHERCCRDRLGFSWRSWPAPLRDPGSAAVAEFAEAHRDRVEFFQFLQWQAELQLAAAARTGRDGGLSLGLYRDLAVGANPHGAEAWADQELVAPGAAIGAPPDALSRAGQDWGLAPFNPLVLRRRGFAPFIAALRANMRHAGILRIDHVMSLNRLYWVPRGRSAKDGAYVAYPFDDLLRIVALESHRQRCAVIGEDLGTVPSGFRERMQAANVLSYRVAVFERRAGGAFLKPAEYPPLAAASAATHDIATLKGFWLGTDIRWRRRLKLYPDSAAENTEIAERARDRRLLLEALAAEGLLPVERHREFLTANGEPHYSRELGDAILAYLGRARSCLTLVQLEDVIGEEEQANLPGTTDGHPNWRRRLSHTLEEILGPDELDRVARLIGEARRHAAAR